MDDLSHMRAALALARRGLGNAWPNPAVGCVLVRDGQVVGRGWTQPGGRPHAETEALRRAGARARGATLYVTLEPCPMCAGAIINSRIPCVVFGARDGRFGSCGSVIDLFSERYGHRPKVYAGVLEEECAQLLSDFFKNMRE